MIPATANPRTKNPYSLAVISLLTNYGNVAIITYNNPIGVLNIIIINYKLLFDFKYCIDAEKSGTSLVEFCSH